jgi:hypothetical protein
MISVDHSVGYWVALGFYFLPLPFLVVGWLKAWPDRGSLGWRVLLLAPSTLSLLWIFAGLISDQALGPSYSSIRYRIIQANFYCMVVSAPIAFAALRGARVYAGIACTILVFVWAYIGAIN